MTTLSLLVLLLSCGGADPLATLAACRDAACRVEALTPAWEADPEGTRRWILDRSDPLEQATLIEGLALARPDEAAALCAALPADGHARTRCERRVVRPHLGGPGKPEASPVKTRPEAAAGPRSSTLPTPTLPPPPWADDDADTRQAALADCTLAQPTLCARAISREHAAQGRWVEAGRACHAGDPDDGAYYDECLFQAAEILAETHGAEGLGAALHLCAWSGFGPMCVAHSLILVGPHVPGADRITAAHVAEAQRVVDAIAAVAAEDERLRAGWVDRYWSAWVGTTVARAQRIDGRLAGLLPPEAQPHLPVALAWRMLRDRDPASLDPDTVTAELEAVLADPGRPPEAQDAGLGPLTPLHRRGTWPTDRGEERQLPAAWVLGPGRRVLADDPAVDLRIAILEAAAQLPTPPPARFFLEPVGDPTQDRLLRWTGARIGAHLDPAAAAALTDPDPLVQGALAPRQGQRNEGSGQAPGPRQQAGGPPSARP